MSYLFDGTANRITKTSVIGAFSISAWFYPDNSAANCTIYCETNAAATRFMRVRITGSTDDKVNIETFDASSLAGATSTGTVNYNAWNHIYAARGGFSPTHAYISLNGETLVDGGAGSYHGPGAMTATVIGCTGTTTRSNFMSGRVGEVAVWDGTLNDADDRYKALALGFDPRLIAQDKGGTSGVTINLISYSPLIGNFADLAVGNSWATVSSPTVAEHCRMHRNLLG